MGATLDVHRVSGVHRCAVPEHTSVGARKEGLR